jgi:hypothetical protein
MEEFPNYTYDPLTPPPVSNGISGIWELTGEESSRWKFHNTNIRGNRISRASSRDLEVEGNSRERDGGSL